MSPRSEESHISPEKCSMKRRTIIVGQGPYQQEHRDIVKGYKGNIIHTTKYSLLTFIPINLFQQFHRVANLYFLFLILLNWVPVVGAFQKEITVIPLLMVLTVIAIKDAVEDYRRYLFDQKINNSVVQVYCGKQKAYIDRRWKDVQVGDFVRLSCNDIIPADILLLYSSDPHGICYIETSNLDGETNLKQRKMVSGLPLQGVEFNPEIFHSHIECENPNNDLGTFRGFMVHSSGARAGLDNNNLLLRSCTIRNTETVVGIVVYAGYRLEMYEAEKNEATDCSVTLKSTCRGKSLSCRSLSCNRRSVSLHTLTAESEEEEQLSNHFLPRTTAFYSQMAKEVVPDPELVKKLSWLCSAMQPSGNVISETTSSLELTYITDFFLTLAICNSVVVSSPTQPEHVAAEVQTSLKSLDEIKLIFQRFSFPLFSGFSTHSPTQSRGSPHSSRLFTRGKTGAFTLSTLSSSTIEGSFVTQEGNVNLSRKEEEIIGEETRDIFGSTNTDSNGASDNAQEMRNEYVIDNDTEDELLYEALSPDEAALVHAARAYRCTLRARSADSLLVDLPGIGMLTVQLLHILPFDSNRKRMSVVVRHPLTGQVTVYTKGADSVIMDLLETPKGPEQARETYNHIKVQTQKHLDSYAREGLRTLCIAKKVLGEEEYEVWLKRQLLAESSIENREELLLDSAERLETNLTLLGTTGIVDRLQEDVPETIESLQRAGIKVWVLTGDKQETAVNIAYACKLIGPNDQILTVNCESKDDCAALLEDLKLKVQRSEERMNKKTTTEDSGELSSGSKVGFIFIIDGRTLDWTLKDHSSCFLELSHSCKAVICCRSTPLQKSQVVQLIRDELKVMTLAVGDGANDVSMIQVADVGIGISGQEGMQAMMSSDFAISRFKHLSKLLLVHGHWCFSRLGNMMSYFIYKNVMFVSLLFWYQFFCGFSGSVMTNSWVLIFFNLFFTSVPPLIYGILDKDIPAEQLMQMPELYQAAHASEAYAPFVFWFTALDAFYQSLVCFFVPYFAYVGSDIGELSFGSPINASALLIILLHQVIESHTLTWIHVFMMVLSAGSYFGFVLLFSICCLTCSPPTNPVGVETLQMSQPLFYIVCTLTTVTALMPRLLFRALHNTS
ncbi:probable phospholipid-transporting ATPase VD isoform X4 [Phyllopteryx taeniolatus]|uniref:probable phospholipid-transporting ATPase VD isoform X4 n=1 Tax=Phyllopteryx taeniolatus TaxID=161469 RepID=UPI002AD26A99|nr:probable phospholipid-transporting ATPase VD isoform X4 [Phyllopteryx taeniolatus]